MDYACSLRRLRNSLPLTAPACGAAALRVCLKRAALAASGRGSIKSPIRYGRIPNRDQRERRMSKFLHKLVKPGLVRIRELMIHPTNTVSTKNIESIVKTMSNATSIRIGNASAAPNGEPFNKVVVTVMAAISAGIISG